MKENLAEGDVREVPKTIVFQGDSITDCSRNRDNDFYQGNGYVRLAAAALEAKFPGQYRCFNRGFSGSRIVDMWGRIRLHMICLQPDYLSILIGVNDVWHEYTGQNGVDAEKFEHLYDLIVSELREELPDTTLILMEPFLLPGSQTENTQEHPDRYAYMRREVELRAKATARIAAKYNLPFVPLQDIFDKKNGQKPNYWTLDGVHPTAFGHELIKRKWLEVFEAVRKEGKENG